MSRLNGFDSKLCAYYLFIILLWKSDAFPATATTISDSCLSPPPNGSSQRLAMIIELCLQPQYQKLKLTHSHYNTIMCGFIHDCLPAFWMTAICCWYHLSILALTKHSAIVAGETSHFTVSYTGSSGGITPQQLFILNKQGANNMTGLVNKLPANFILFNN